MFVLMSVLGWCLLFALCWPLALVALVLAPVVWLLALPFLLAGTVLAAMFSLVAALLFLPARLVGKLAR